MISTIDPSPRRAASSIYELEVVLDGIKPAVTRRLQVPGRARLDWLHAVLQVAVGWTNSHLHRFEAGGVTYSDTRDFYTEFEGDPEVIEERGISLRHIAPNEGCGFLYEYDFGDSWSHRIAVVRILPPDPAAATMAVCVGGARACPPEDCGGIAGYASLLKILKNRRHPEHEFMKGWVGRPFDAEAFDATAVNAWLLRLRWPHVTEAGLRRVLMVRDAALE